VGKKLLALKICSFDVSRRAKSEHAIIFAYNLERVVVRGSKKFEFRNKLRNNLFFETFDFLICVLCSSSHGIVYGLWWIILGHLTYIISEFSMLIFFVIYTFSWDIEHPFIGSYPLRSNSWKKHRFVLCSPKAVGSRVQRKVLATLLFTLIRCR
jgi:hypothetical protein